MKNILNDRTSEFVRHESGGFELAKAIRACLLLAAILGFASSLAQAASGDVDSGFDPNPSDYIAAIAMQPDGRIVVAGSFTTVGGASRNYIARLNADGTVGSSFDPDANSRVYATAVQTDGKIIIAGTFTTIGGTARNRIARLNADGTLDTSFDPNANGSVYGIAVQTDGKIIVTGFFSTIAGTARNRIARLNADGTLDTSFDPNADTWVYGTALQTDGKIVIYGAFTSVGGKTRNHIARLNADGTLDDSFDPNANTWVYAAAVQVDRKIVIVGSFSSLQPNSAASPTTRNNIARLNSDGTVDASFDPNAAGFAGTVAIQADGKIVVGGGFLTFQPNGAATATWRKYVARLNTDGTLDASFNPEVSNWVYGLALQANGKLLLGGLFSTVDGVARNYAARLENDPVTQYLAASSANRVQWMRAGAAPEAQDVCFQWSAIGSTTWTTLGTATRIAHGWELTGLDLPATGRIRALARVIGGEYNGSSGLIAQTTPYNLGNPPSVVNRIADYSVDEDAPDTVIDLRWVFEDAETADPDLVYSFEGTDNPELISATADNTTDRLTVHYLPNQSGPATITVRATDETGLHDETSFIVTVNRRNDGDLADADTSFDPNVDGTAGTTAVTTAALQPDGKIVIGGSFNQLSPNGTATSTTRNNIARLNADGTLDSGFNPNANKVVDTLAVQADGKIILGGYFTTLQPSGAAAATTRNYIARLRPDGRLDASFDPNVDNRVYAVAVQSDGKIVLGGNFTKLQPNGAATPTARNFIARVNSDGSLDTGFDPNANFSLLAIALQPDGKIIIGGLFTTLQPNGSTTSYTKNYIARLNADGTLDDSFNASADSLVFAIAVQPDGKVLIGGWFDEINGTEREHIARLNADGTLDESFVAAADASVYTLVLQADGKAILGGSFTEINGAYQKYVARLNSDGSLDEGFNPDCDDAVTSLAVQSDGAVIVVGDFETVDGLVRNRIARLVNDATTQSLAVSSASRVEWLRGGASPEASEVNFELSINGGVTWTTLGAGTHITGGWELTGLSLPAGGQLRARARVTDDDSSGLVQTTTTYVLPVELTGMTRLRNGSFRFDFTSMRGATFTVLASSDIALPVSQWTELGSAREVFPGQYQFVDTDASSHTQRFYQVRWP